MGVHLSGGIIRKIRRLSRNVKKWKKKFTVYRETVKGGMCDTKTVDDSKNANCRMRAACIWGSNCRVGLNITDLWTTWIYLVMPYLLNFTLSERLQNRGYPITSFEVRGYIVLQDFAMRAKIHRILIANFVEVNKRSTCDSFLFYQISSAHRENDFFY